MNHRFRPVPIRLIPSALIVLVGVLTKPACGQVPDSIQPPPVIQEEPAPEQEAVPGRISPRGAFIRSSLIPGWGHTKVGAYVRGGFYFAIEATSAVMIFKTQTRIAAVENRLEVREAVVTTREQAKGVTDAGAIEAALASDEEVQDLRLLRETRLDQREDWVAFGLFLMLIGGVDAYVSAHLADFPTAVIIEPTSAGTMELRFSLPLNF